MNAKQRKARKVLWNIFCSATPTKFSPFTSDEYFNEFIPLGYYLSQFYEAHEYIFSMGVEEKVLFFLFLFEAFPDIS